MKLADVRRQIPLQIAGPTVSGSRASVLPAEEIGEQRRRQDRANGDPQAEGEGLPDPENPREGRDAQDRAKKGHCQTGEEPRVPRKEICGTARHEAYTP